MSVVIDSTGIISLMISLMPRYMQKELVTIFDVSDNFGEVQEQYYSLFHYKTGIAQAVTDLIYVDGDNVGWKFTGITTDNTAISVLQSPTGVHFVVVDLKDVITTVQEFYIKSRFTVQNYYSKKYQEMIEKEATLIGDFYIKLPPKNSYLKQRH